MGARYAYKLWVPYKHYDRHEYVHAVEYRDLWNWLRVALEIYLKT